MSLLIGIGWFAQAIRSTLPGALKRASNSTTRASVIANESPQASLDCYLIWTKNACFERWIGWFKGN